MRKIGTLVTLLATSVVVALFIANYGSPGNRHTTDASKAHATVEIVNSAKNSGGSGVILSSNEVESAILTNRHICELLQEGGYVITDDSKTYAVSSFRASDLYDLCVINVNANLKDSTAIADEPPARYSECTIVGHPSLLPTIITKGHFSDKGFYWIQTGPATIQIREIQAVSATIQPGSSGSAVYNGNGELAGLVQAGQGSLSYGLIVPFENVFYFLREELKHLTAQVPRAQELNVFQLLFGNRNIRKTVIGRTF